MTENEAIKWQKALKKTYKGFPVESEEACDIAIKALEEVQEYRKLGTVEEVRAAVDKEKDKKRIEPITHLDKYYHESACPNCGSELRAKVVGYTLKQAIGEYNNCPWCGQKLEE